MMHDAFYCEQEEKMLKGQNKNYCYFCKKLTDTAQKQIYYILPGILIIILNRGKNNQDFNEPFRFDEILDLSNIGLNLYSYKKYFLTGIITQLVNNGFNEHFISFCRNNMNDNFICYNDTSVTPVSIIDAMSAKIPYILIYHYIK